MKDDLLSEVRGSLPTVVLVGGTLTLSDGSRIDSRQRLKDASTARAVRGALVASSDWWATVASLVVPSLDDTHGGFALADSHSVTRVARDGSVRTIRRSRTFYPRGKGREDYVSADGVRTPPGIRIVTSGQALRAVRDARAAQVPSPMVVLPDTVEIRKRVDDLLSGETVEPAGEDVAWRIPIVTCACRLPAPSVM